MTTPAEIAEVVAKLRESIAHQLKVVGGYPAWCEEARQACLLIERLDAARVEAERGETQTGDDLVEALRQLRAMTDRAESAERERETHLKRWMDSEAKLAACDSDLRAVELKRDALAERIANAPHMVIGETLKDPNAYWAGSKGTRVAIVALTE